MGLFRKTIYEKHAENLHKKLLNIVKILDSREMKSLCSKILKKTPRNGTKIFDADYNLIKKFGTNISRSDYQLFFSHYQKRGKINDLKLAKYLVYVNVLDSDDTDYLYLQEKDHDDFTEFDTQSNRANFSKDTKDQILKIQKYKCAVPNCITARKDFQLLEFDHIKGRDDNSLSNCQALCPFHHRLKTQTDNMKTQAERGQESRQYRVTGRGGIITDTESHHKRRTQFTRTTARRTTARRTTARRTTARRTTARRTR
jgi:hypothetical protein